MDNIISKLRKINEQIASVNTYTCRKILLKVFLGGTCNNTTWRDELIQELKIPYFNPVVDDWTEDCIEIENDEKENHCGIHLYVITPEMVGTYSIAEAVQSSNSENKLTCFCLLDRDKFDEKVLKSLIATKELLSNNGARIFYDLRELADYLNSLLNYVEQNNNLTENGPAPMMTTYPLPVIDPTKIKLPNKAKKELNNGTEKTVKV